MYKCTACGHTQDEQAEVCPKCGSAMVKADEVAEESETVSEETM